ncbi:hypothetical protein NM688_g7195 [Phlebia brevispora]|uniref:Uncharacterized protein n=1 Tax=Phlebia brevispora TaxID=194682 RepID=A0ACC1S860_9APHY|nr:hypothetical protein NM688_g7195 [Phlebia brevispora]
MSVSPWEKAIPQSVYDRTPTEARDDGDVHSENVAHLDRQINALRTRLIAMNGIAHLPVEMLHEIFYQYAAKLELYIEVDAIKVGAVPVTTTHLFTVKAAPSAVQENQKNSATVAALDRFHSEYRSGRF